MKRVVVTGLGWTTSIGNNQAEVVHSLKNGITGISVNPDFAGSECPVKLAGVPKGFQFPTTDVEDWIFPKTVPISREQLRAMSPNALYGYFAMHEAIRDAKLPPELVSNPRTGTLCASAGSVWLSYENAVVLAGKGALRCNPMCVVSSIPGTLNINLAACFKIKGTSLGFASACASSSHAIGHGVDLIRLGRQDIIFAVGAEDCSKFTIQPFAAVRALSSKTDPRTTPCAFDAGRDGFIACGGATVLVLEELEHAQKRGSQIYAEIIGWGESADGFNVMAPEPEGEGLARCMVNALQDSSITPDQVDYINAHATSTPAGDVAEIKAIKKVFTGKKPYVSSTKSLTGHGLSLAGALEAGICCLALKEGFMPVSANITCLDPACEGVPVITKPMDAKPSIVMSNSSGFGGTNVSLVLKK